MQLAVSSLGWKAEDTTKIIQNFSKNSINSIEGIFSKIKPWEILTEKDVLDYRNFLHKHSIKVPSIQSLFYNSPVSTLQEVDKVIEHFRRVLKYSEILSSKVLVFGSPSLRKSYPSWEYDLQELFYILDKMLQQAGVVMVIEPNAKIYRGDYFFTVEEIVEFLQRNSFTNIFTMIDTHNSFLEKKNTIVDFLKYSSYIKHIHISEEELQPLRTFKFHKEFSKVLAQQKYSGVVTYELKECTNFESTVNTFYKIYSNENSNNTPPILPGFVGRI